ncbi:MAG: YjjG family noncanonical pyrimidine nucleotidase [Muribaculaceae bacterium]|nr:YjjG family noncanonical pyrimidine nucleotidase [Muribaculaceae bacterium]
MNEDKHELFQSVTTVFIDLDDTLWDFAANSAVALRRVYDHFAVSRWQPDYALFASAYERRNAQLWHDYHHGRVSREFLLAERFRHALQCAGCLDDCTRLGADMNEWYLNCLATLPAAVPGARELLVALQGAGLPAYVLSNGFAGVQQRKLASAGLAGLVSGLILSDDCGITKPQRGIFDYALSRTGATAGEVVMVGDDPDTDILGAHDAGWLTIYFNPKCRPAAPATATAQVTSLLQVPHLLGCAPAEE